MSQSQWRQIFRLIFKGANDYEFADRIFHTIAGNHSQKSVTFEDLIFCLYDLIQSFNVHGAAQPLMENAVPSTTTAQFTFSIMEPDSRVRVCRSLVVKNVKNTQINEFYMKKLICTYASERKNLIFGRALCLFGPLARRLTIANVF